MLERVAGAAGVTLPPPVLAAAKDKYAQIGGKSPSYEISLAICEQLKTALHDRAQSDDCVRDIEIGMIFTEPLIEDSLQKLRDAGCTRIVYLSMTAYESFAAWSGPFLRVREAATKLGISEVLRAPVFGEKDCFVQAHIDYLTEAYEGHGSAEDIHYLFVAHSLPIDDPQETSAIYEQQLLNAAARIDTVLPAHAEPGDLSYVSIGARGGAWLRPSLKEALARLRESIGDTGEQQTVIVCPLGFSTDHMEVLYDLDIDAAQEAERLDFDFVRTPTLATLEAIHPALIEALVDCVQEALQKGSTA